MTKATYLKLLETCRKCKKGYSKRGQFDECPHKFRDPLREKIRTEGIQAAQKWWKSEGRR